MFNNEKKNKSLVKCVLRIIKTYLIIKVCSNFTYIYIYVMHMQLICSNQVICALIGYQLKANQQRFFSNI